MYDLAAAQRKWERKTANAGEKWKANTSGKGQYLREAGAGPQTVAAWEAGVSAISASDFQNKVSGRGEKWARNTAAGWAR